MRLVYALFTLLVSLFFTIVGLICLLIPWFSAIRTHIIVFIIENALVISLFGTVFLMLGIIMMINAIYSLRHRYYRLRGNTDSILVDENLIQQYLDKYWKDLFPKHDIPSQLHIKNNQLHISVDFPFYPISEQRSLLERIEKELAELFHKILGYNKDFYLSAKFSNE